jgi:hypothetical protein
VITFTARDKPGSWEPDYSCDPIYDASVVLPTFPCGIPDLLENSDSDSSLTSETYTIAAQFGVDMDDVGEEIAIGLYGAEETLALSYYGTPTLVDTGWDLTNTDAATSGTEYSTTGYTYVAGISRNATTTTTTT